MVVNRDYERPMHGQRKRCQKDGCNGFARRNSAFCQHHGGGNRKVTKHEVTDNGVKTRTKPGVVQVSGRVMQLLDGEISIEDLDDEELARGYPRSKDGSFRGAPTLIPKAMHDRMVRELFRRANAQLSTGLVAAAELMTSVVLNEELPMKERTDAAKWLMERVMGKIPDVIVTGSEKQWEKLFDTIHRGAAATSPMIIDGEVIDDGREP